MKNTTQPEASIIIVSFNTREILRGCLRQTLAATRSHRVEIIVVDNASRDSSADMVAEAFPQVRLVRSHENLGFAAGNNAGFQYATGRYVVLLNPDALIDAISFNAALDHMRANPEVGLAGGRLLDRNGSDQPSARQFPSLLNEFLVLTGLAARFPRSRLFGRFDRTWANPADAAEVDWVPGAFTIMRHDVLRQLGLFDERFFLYYEEVDLCRRFKAAGWKICYWPDIVIHHTGGESSKTVEQADFSKSGSQLTLWRMRSGLLYYRKHHGQVIAWLVAQLETLWHALRELKARTAKGSESKAAESHRIAELMQRAWRETMGGTITPPRPW